MQHFFVSKRFLINNYHQQKISFESISQHNIKCNFCIIKNLTSSSNHMKDEIVPVLITDQKYFYLKTHPTENKSIILNIPQDYFIKKQTRVLLKKDCIVLSSSVSALAAILLFKFKKYFSEFRTTTILRNPAK